MKTIKIVKIDKDYLDYLRNFEEKIYEFKQNRPYIGALLKVKDMEYFAPLSSPKAKHQNMSNFIDFMKIEVKNRLVGVINFNNMIPVTSANYEVLDLNQIQNSSEEQKYYNLLKADSIFLNRNKDKVYRKSEKLYDYYQKGKLNLNIMNRCCNFPLLEEKCLEYNHITV